MLIRTILVVTMVVGLAASASPCFRQGYLVT